jgi:LytS/YehU family sensor histidine kinase
MKLFLTKEERFSLIGFNDIKFVLFGIPLTALFIKTAFFYHPVSETGNHFWLEYLESIIHTSVYWIGFRVFVIFLRRKYHGFKFTRKRIYFEVAFIIIFSTTVAALLKLILKDIIPCDFESGPLQGYLATYFTAAFIISIYEGVYLYYQNKLNILKTEQLKQEHVRSELQGLRNQVNPHFLFNSMNTLMNIINEDQKLASSFLKKLSNVYRYILEKREEQLIPLKEELGFIESYLFLQKERFRNNLHVDFNINDKYLNRYVVPLSLQILFENAIKHNVISSKHPLRIEVYVDESDNLVVENSLRRKEQFIQSTGVGLQNITSRFGYFTKSPVVIEETEAMFAVRIPLILEQDKDVLQ